jgi:hypothetical protein
VFAVSHVVRFIAVLLATAAACVDTPPMAEPIVESTHVEIKELPAERAPKLDVVVFVDDTLPMSAYEHRLAEIPRLLANALESTGGGWIDLRLAVTSNDGTFHRLPGSESSYLTRSLDFNFRVWQNFEGSLEDALRSLIAVNAHSEGPSQPLDAVRRALERNSRFVREDAGLGILIVTASDDASPWPIADYATWLTSIVGGSWHRPIVVEAVYPQPAPRLDELTNEAPRFYATSIDSLNYSSAVTGVTFAAAARGWGGAPCMDGAVLDRDPITPGLQYDCVLSVYIDDELRPVPQCFGVSKGDFIDHAFGSALPTSACFSLPKDPKCSGPSMLGFQLHGYTNSTHPAFHLECRTQ